MYDMMNGNWGSGMFVSGLIWILFLVLLIVLIIFLVNKLSGTGNSSSSTAPLRDESLNILKERFARGEISEEEYDRIKQKLKEK
ncbi:SHOCT domain-containing protein [Alkalicoccus halolimnae]|uniref:SHOCT domain-containing protein n=1 Tax=Alkalicoccus halolimnae TaxID=1667239 RepID=A0A5C7FFH3_9BACI|nr:SHOCT domain-containing protein [Alkalicoccus halolimnae]TXF81192.1 SHOCT domain-containing protein [Alkalicoccus halolimnae]